MEGKDDLELTIREENTQLFMQYKGKDYVLEQDTYKEYRCEIDNPLQIRTLQFVIDKKGYVALFKANETYYEKVTYDSLTFDSANYTPIPQTSKKGNKALVSVREIDPTITCTLKFMPKESAYLEKETAYALKKANQSLQDLGYKLIVLDAYRENPIEGLQDKDTSFQTGKTVSVTLFNTKYQQGVEFGGSYLEFSERSTLSYPGGTSLERWHRQFLRNVMTKAGFSGIDTNWWKFSYKVVN